MRTTTRRGRARYGSLTLIECLIAIAVPSIAGAQTNSCTITARPPGPVQPGAYAQFDAVCTPGYFALSWYSSLANCEFSNTTTTTCQFPQAGTVPVTVSAGYWSCLNAQSTYPMQVSSTAPPTCLVRSNPAGPLQPGARAQVTAYCSGQPTSIQWTSTLATCAPLTGVDTVCDFATAGSAQVSAKASYGGSFASDALSIIVSSSGNPTCYIDAVPPGPVQPGASVKVTAHCTQTPTAVSWFASWPSTCAQNAQLTTVCNFPTEGTTTLQVIASGFAGGPVGASYAMPVRFNATPSCSIQADPPSPLKPGAWSRLTSGCSGAPATIQWSSNLGTCSPSNGPTTLCAFPSVGAGAVSVSASYPDLFAGSLATDSYPVTVSTGAADTCLIVANPPSPVLFGTSSQLTARCSGTPVAFQWYPPYANCSPLTSQQTTCTFSRASTSQIALTATYAAENSMYTVFRSYDMEVVFDNSFACWFALAPTDLSNVPAAGAVIQVLVSAGAERCAVARTSFQPWVTFGGNYAYGPSTWVTILISPNPGPSRATSIVLGDRLYFVMQQQGP